MAIAAGLQMPKTHLVELKVNGKDEAFFAVQRFDRDVNRKIHFLSLSGYLHATHRVPSLEYASGVLAATMKLTKSQAEVEKAFRLMLFNVLAHNKDDHAKNFAYLMDPAANGAWELAPAYDLTFNTGMGNEHMTSISGAGNPDINDIKKVAVARKVKNWEKILEEVRSAVSDWPKYANSFDVPKARIASIQKNLRDIDQRCSPTVARPKPSRK